MKQRHTYGRNEFLNRSNSCTRSEHTASSLITPKTHQSVASMNRRPNRRMCETTGFADPKGVISLHEAPARAPWSHTTENIASSKITLTVAHKVQKLVSRLLA